MMLKGFIYKWVIHPGGLLIAILLLLIPMVDILGQEPPPRPITVTVTPQNLSFGAFSHGPAGGTVSIDPDGSRTSTGSIVLLFLGYSFSAAMYEITANPGTVVSILNGPDVSLPGSNGGSMSLHIGNSSPISPFVTTAIPPATTLLYIGGTLTVGNAIANPPGNYSGTFNITFVQE
jgi:hypothetical protein